MSVDLSKCKVGDTIQSENGDVHKITATNCCDAFPFGTDTGYCFGAKGNYLTSGSHYLDIVAVAQRKPANRKVATFEIKKGCPYPSMWNAFSKIAGMNVVFNYGTKKDAIRGARRFCKTIGFECVIKEGE